MILRILLCLLIILISCVAQKSFTKLAFFSEYENKQQQDYIELGVLVKAQGTNLVIVMNEASKIAEQIKKISIQFCEAHLKKKSECKQIVEIENYAIKPKYQVIKRQSKFIGFEVEHKVKIKVLPVDHISDLADTIIRQKNTKIQSFEWKSLKQANAQQVAVSLGTQQGKQLCYELDMHLKQIINVEELTKQSNQKVSVFKFEIQCQEGRVEKKKKEKKPKKSVNDPKDSQKKKKDVKNKSSEQKTSSSKPSKSKSKQKNDQL